MKLGNYSTLEQKDLRALFNDYSKSIDIPLIDYIAIGVQDNIHKESTSMMSREDWQFTFKENRFAEHDPVRRTAFNTCINFFAFDEVDYQDSFGKKIMQERKRHEIENGLVIMDRQLGFNYMLTLATGYKNFNPRRFYLDHYCSIEKIFDDLKEMVKPSTKNYQLKIC